MRTLFLIAAVLSLTACANDNVWGNGDGGGGAFDGYAGGDNNVNPGVPRPKCPAAQLVTITGQGFVDGVTTVRFSGQASPMVTVIDDNTLMAEVPRSARAGKRRRTHGRVAVEVSTGPGTASVDGGYAYTLNVKVPPK